MRIDLPSPLHTKDCKEIMKAPAPSHSLLRLWTIANAEAWLCRGTSIEPVHFWIAALKMTDPKIPEALLDGGASAETCKEQSDAARALLAYLEMDESEATERRRRERGKLLRGREPRTLPEDGKIPYLHRSESSRRLFEIAIRKAAARSASSLTPLHLVESIFDMRLASLSAL